VRDLREIIGRLGGNEMAIRGAEDTTPADHLAGEYPDATLHYIPCDELAALREASRLPRHTYGFTRRAAVVSVSRSMSLPYLDTYRSG
jgi:hypothetical protein